MNLKNHIPKDFYKLFGSKYLDYYMIFLVAIYEESSQSYSTLGLTEQECRNVINERMGLLKIDWGEERIDEDGTLLSQLNMAAVCVAHFQNWGWMKLDYDETLNCNVVSFPEYSQLYVELFQKLLTQEDGKERENILAIYSYLYTYSQDREKNNDILKNALKTSKRLVQLLSNMQEGMRSYFDELSKQREFRGIQEVLIREINNSDSKKYAILTTTDSFYRYKESVKELIDEGLTENELQRQKFEGRRLEMEESSKEYIRNERSIEICKEAIDIILDIEREFDTIEKRYNKLIEQKTIFACRASARIRYILQEGMNHEDQTLKLIHLLAQSERKQEILADLAERMRVSSQYRVITEQSFYSKRDKEPEEFKPMAIDKKDEKQDSEMEEFIIKPLYTRQQIRKFIKQNTRNGQFIASEETVQNVEDLEKLFLVWQEMTEHTEDAREIEIGEEITTEHGLRFSSLVIKEELGK